MATSITTSTPGVGAAISGKPTGSFVTVGGQNYAYNGGGSQVTSDSSGTRAANTATGNDISRYMSGFNDSALRAAQEAEARQIQAEREALNARRDAEVANINQSFADTKIGTERAQGEEYAGRATNLITAGGGFLGSTQSQQGVLQKLRETQRAELTALETKKQSAILQAKSAYDDKDFALARDLVKSAREVEQQIYQRQKDYADQQIQLSRYAEQDRQTQLKESLDSIDRASADIYKNIEGMSPAAKDVYIRNMAASLGTTPQEIQNRISSIELSNKNQDRAAISTLATKYPSAGIDPSKDTIITAAQKVRGSREYNQDWRKAEADIAATNRSNQPSGSSQDPEKISLMTKELRGLSDKNGHVSPSDYKEGLRNWLLSGGTLATYEGNFKIFADPAKKDEYDFSSYYSKSSDQILADFAASLRN